MSLLTVLVVRNSHILTGIYFILLKKRSTLNVKSIYNQIEKDHGKEVKSEQWKDRGSSYQRREILVALVLEQNCVKGIRVTKIPKQIKFEEVWVRSKKLLPETITHKIFETSSTFDVKWRTTGKLNSSFSGDFYQY